MHAKKLLWLAPVLGAATVGVMVTQSPTRAVQAEKLPASEAKPAVELPVSQVVLFNSGVGYFARSGEVTGDARVELSFPETDINDLLKSLTLEDFGKGRIETVGYDSREPIGRTLASYAVNLADNPTIAQILMQTRGERVEVQLSGSDNALPATVTGTVVSVEKVKLPAPKDAQPVETDAITLSTADGLRTVKMPDVVRVKFLNPVIEAELKKALETLARSHDAAKKSVNLNFTGEGKRRVRVGYVVEAPIWKTSYRLVLDKEGKPSLQGWAIVENPTDEDWKNVKMALVSGRPISFKMDLYDPLYAKRPTVEPELFASLRPPAYEGGLGGKLKEMAADKPKPDPNGRGEFRGAEAKLAAEPDGPAVPGLALPKPHFLRRSLDSVEEEKRQRYAQQLGKDLSQKMDLSAATASATAGQLGDYFQYVIDHPVSIARQKSAMIPVINHAVESTRVSIYNQAVQAKHPLLGLKFKNTTGTNLAQGPITVFEGSSYAGDSRVMDLQPGEERLLAYAIDLGTEVVPRNATGSGNVTGIRAKGGMVTITRKFREEKVYKAVNRSETDRKLIVEHPNRTNQGYKLVEPAKPMEETAELLRFQLPLPAGKSAELKVVEERINDQIVTLTNANPDTFRFLIGQANPSPELKQKLEAASKLQAQVQAKQQELNAVNAEVNRITQDQNRIRQNLANTPREAEVYKTYLSKLSAQEKELDTLTDRQKALAGEIAAAQKAFNDYVMGLEG